MLFHTILLMICWLNSSSLFQTILTYFAPLNISQTALSYILITIKTVLSLINVSLTWNLKLQDNCGCSTEWECQFSRPESSFFKDREPQGQMSILAMPVTVLCLAQFSFFFLFSFFFSLSFWEVGKGQVTKCFAPRRLVRKIWGGGRIFICLSASFPITLHCFQDQTDQTGASRAAPVVLTKLGRKPHTPAERHPGTWTLLAPSLTHKQAHLPEYSPPNPPPSPFSFS